MTQTESAQDFDHAIKDEDIERAKLLLGVDAPASIDEFYRQLSVDAIRNFARGYGDDNSLFVEPEYAAPHPVGRCDRTADDPLRVVEKDARRPDSR